MKEDITYRFWTVCLVCDGDYVLLLDRRHDAFTGFIPPGGKVVFPESFTDAAIREVKEETGLDFSELQYKGLYEYVNPVKNDRYLIFNYMTSSFSGSLLADAPEGKPVWVHKEEALQLPMQPSIRRRFPLFFEEGTFEIHVEWDEKANKEGQVTIRKT